MDRAINCELKTSQLLSYEHLLHSLETTSIDVDLLWDTKGLVSGVKVLTWTYEFV